MNNLRTNIIFWLSISYFVIYGLLFWITGYEITSVVLAGLIFGLAAMVFVTWFTTAVEAFKTGGRNGPAILAFMVCVVAFYSMSTRVWAVYKIGIGSPDWTNSSWIGLSNAVMLLIFFTGILLAPQTEEGDVPRRNFVLWAAAIFVAGVFIGVSVGVAIVAPTGRADARPMFPSVDVPACNDVMKPIPVRAYCRARPNIRTATPG